MTFASVRGAAQEAAKRGQLSPHQLAALGRLDETLTDDQRQEFTDLWRAEGSPAAAADPAWLAPTMGLIKPWEGLRLEAYRCPAGVPSLGYGSTRIDGRAVRMGDTITTVEAESLLRRELLDLFGPGLFALLPMASRWRPEQQAALLSWAFNVGLGAAEESTLRKRVLAGEDPVLVVREELPRWDKADGKTLPGLARRRAAEVALFAGGQQPAKPAAVRPLAVRYMRQTDSALAGEHDSSASDEMCFSSTCAMLADFLKPGSFPGPQGDDQYLQRLRAMGGKTTVPQAHIKLLNSIGIPARFVSNGDWAAIEAQLARGIPVPVGWLHHGPASRPTGGGHWSLVTDLTADAVIMHDPNGEADLVNGGYLPNLNGASQRYSRKNWGPRWLVDGPRSGWMIQVA
jgi:GH24 family phage-related lysozyme (muramidase)